MSPVSACFQVTESTDELVLALGKASARLARVDERVDPQRRWTRNTYHHAKPKPHDSAMHYASPT